MPVPTPASAKRPIVAVDSLRVLVVVPDLPHPPFIGFHLRALSLLRALAGVHEVTVVGSAPADADLTKLRSIVADVVATPELQNTALISSGRRGRRLLSQTRASLLPLPTFRASYSQAIARLVESTVERLRPEAMQLEGYWALHYVRPGLPTVVSLHDVFSSVCTTACGRVGVRRSLAVLQGRSYRRLEKRVLPTLAGTITISSEDQRTLAALGVDSSPVPFAIDLPHEPRRAHAVELEDGGAHDDGVSRPLKLLFVGTFESSPNRLAAAFIESQLAAALEQAGIVTSLTLAGRRAAPVTSSRHSSVIYAPDVESLAPLYADADVALAPLPYGGGVKTKTLEAMSWGLPVIGSPAAFTGIDAGDEPPYMQTPLDPAAMVAAVARLSDDPTLRAKLGAASRRFVAEHHSQEATDAAVAELYARLAADTRRR